MRSSTSLAASRAGLASFRARATAAGRSSARKLGHAQDVSMRAGGVRIASGLGWKGVGPAPRTDVLAPLAAWKWIRGVPVRCRIAVPAPTPSRSYSHALCPPSRLALHNTRLAPACLTSREPRATRKCAVRRRWLDRGRSMAWAVCVHRQQARRRPAAQLAADKTASAFTDLQRGWDTAQHCMAPCLCGPHAGQQQQHACAPQCATQRRQD